MRIWAEVYNAAGNKLGDSQLNDIVTTKVKRELDAAGSFDFTVAPTKQAFELLQNEREVRVFFKRDEESARELYRGYIRQNRIGDGKSPDLNISGVTKMDALARRSVLLGRAYDAKTISYIANDLIGLVPGWNVEVAPAIANDLQTSRFDGSSVLRAFIRTAEEKGVHIREGLASNTVEIGAFGESNGLRFIKPPSTVGTELEQNDDVVLVSKVTQTDNTADVVNWIIPLGAGEGSAALSLKNSTRTAPYPIRTMTAPNGQVLYYLSDSASVLEYGQIERVTTFKEIAPIANSDAAKVLAANALYDAAAAWLQRNSVKLTSYKLSGVKVSKTIRPGDKIRIAYTGTADTADGQLTYIDIKDEFWVMGVTESFSKAGLTVDLDVTTIDRHTQDIKRVVVGMLDAIDVRNLSVQTFPFWSEKTYNDYVEYIVGGSSGRQANFKIEIDNAVTDLLRVVIRFKTRPFFVLGRVRSQYQTSGTNFDYVFNVIEGDQHPKGLHIYINGVDVSTALGGPWNNDAGGTDNTALDVEADITSYLVSAGIYNDHPIVFKAEINSPTAYPVPGFSTLALNGQASSGIIELDVRILGVARAIAPS